MKISPFLYLLHVNEKPVPRALKVSVVLTIIHIYKIYIILRPILTGLETARSTASVSDTLANLATQAVTLRRIDIKYL